MKNIDLQKLLKQYPDDARIWIPAFNGEVETYAELDHVFADKHAMFANDFFGTPGRMDKRVLQGNDDDTIIMLDSKFGITPNTEVDF